MLRKVKRIASIVLTAAFIIVMLTSCKALSVVNSDPVVLKVGDRVYKYSDYAEIFNSELYTYVYGGGEAEYNPNYASQSSTERLKVFQDYAYDKLIERAMKDYIIETEKLADKLTDDDNEAIDKLVEDAILSDAQSAKESDVSESDTTLEEMKQVTEAADDAPTAEEIKEAEDGVDTEAEAAVASKMAVTTDTDDVTKSDEAEEPADDEDSDVTASDDAKKSMTREEAEAAVAEENGYDTYEEYVKATKEQKVFSLYFEHYKPLKARELFEADYEKDHDGKTFEDYKKELREEKQEQYLIDTKVEEFLVGDYTATEDEAKEYYDEQMKKYEEMEDSDYYSYLDSALKSEDEDATVWYVKEGYYYVKHILLEKVETTSSDTTESGDTTASDEVRVDPEKQEKVEARIAEINAMENEDEALKAFDILMEEYGTDPGMQSEPAKTTGYLMGKGNSMVEEFSTASEELFAAGRIGAVSGAVKSSYGIHYIQLVSKVEPQKVTFEEVKDEAIKAATDARVDAQLSEKIDSYKDGLKITEYRVRIRSIGADYASMYFASEN